MDAMPELRDIHLPDPVPFWPPAPGWWMLAALLVAAVIVAVVAARRRRRRQRVRRAALAQLESLARAHDEADTTLAASLSELLRRACLSVFPREDVAGLTGEHWLRFLDEVLRRHDDGHLQSAFLNGAGRALVTAPFVPRAEYDRDALIMAARALIEALPEAPESGR